MIKTINLTKDFGSIRAVDNLCLDIPEGELFAFLGPNGAGKTTTIKMLTGLLKPTSGKIFIGGYDIEKDYLKAKALISYIPDAPFLYDKLTGREFLNLVAGLYGLEREEKRKIPELLDFFGLSSWENRLVEDYSHGMRQKLIMGASLLHHPRLIIIDEPLVGLDPRSARQVKDVLKRKSQEEGVTIFISTHTLSLAEELAGRIGIIDRGRLIALGTVEELKRQAHSSGKLEETFLKLTEDEG